MIEIKTLTFKFKFSLNMKRMPYRSDLSLKFKL